MEYSKFIKKIVTDFISFQEIFKTKYKIDDYANWYYEQATEILTLSTDEEEINFKYIPVGTFSNKSNTWMWAWENTNSIEKNKLATLKIKEFGIQSKFKELTEGHFEGDKFTGWEMTAMTNHILNGIGGYRVEVDHLEKYFLIVEQIDNELANKLNEKLIDCEKHGAGRHAFICQHLNNKTKTGFKEVFPTWRGMDLEEDDDFQAWCFECEKVRLEENGWTEKAMEFVGGKVVCENCFFEIKEFNLEG